MKTDLVAAASHELRTPLASMRVLVDGLLADEQLDPLKTREYLEMVATRTRGSVVSSRTSSRSHVSSAAASSLLSCPPSPRPS